MGVLLGESVIGIEFENAELAHALGFGALAIILAEGGLTTNWRETRGSVRLGVLLATVGVTVSVGVVALGAHYLLGMSWELAVLLGAVTSPTDAAAVFSVIRVVPLPRRITGALEAESGFNDAPTVVLVTLISSGAAADHGPVVLAGIIVFELVAGVLIGARRRVRRCLDHAAGRTAGLRPLPDRGAVPGAAGLRRRGVPCTPADSLRSTSRRWCWATPISRTAPSPEDSPRDWPGSRRSGCS